MYKSRLQELCHQKSWGFPSYSCSRDGPDHQPQFKAAVLVNGVSFDSPNLCKSSKEAQNEAAKIAFDHFTTPLPSYVSSPPSVSSPTGSSSASNIFENSPSVKGNLFGKNEDISKICASHGNALGVEEEIGDVQYPYKSQLQNYVQKRSLSLPIYSCMREGSDHAPLFRALVTVDGQTFESPDFCRTLKEAEHAAAKVALSALSKAGPQEDDFPLFKNLLQDLARKEGFSIPIFRTTVSGASHTPTFMSTVEVEGDVFHRVSATTKKQAEMNAAKVAYFAIKERILSRTFSSPPQSGVAQEAPVCSNTSLESTITADFQQKLSLRYISNLTPIVRSEENTDGTLEPGLAGSKIEEVKTIAEDPMKIPRSSRTGFERLQIPVPSPVTSITEYGSSSPTTVLDCYESSVRKPYRDLPATEDICDRVMVYPRRPNMKLGEGTTVLPISDDKWVAVSLDYPNEGR